MLSRYIVFAVAAVFGVVDAFFWPARDSVVPLLVDKEHLATANNVIQISQQLSMVVGPLLAAVLLSLATYPVRFASLSIAYILSSLVLATLPVLRAASGVVEGRENGAPGSALKDLRAGITYVLSLRIITIIMVVSLFLNLLVMGPLNIGLPVLVKKMG